MASIYSYNFLNSLAASGADVNMVNSNIRFNGAPPVNMKQATVSQFVDPITLLREQWVFTPTAANAVGQVYSFRLQQVVNGRNISKVFSYTSVTNADTRLAICTALARVVNLDPELSVVATVTGSNPNETLTITASATSPDLIVTIISVGNGFTIPSTPAFVNGAGAAVSLSAPTGVTSVSTGANGLVTISATNTNIVAGMLVNYTIAPSGETITFADGSTTVPGQIVTVRVGGTISGSQFQIGPSTDSNIESITFTTIAAARVATLQPSFVRGTGTELAARGIVGATAANVYAEVKLNWLETPPNGGAPISKTHSVFVNSGDANYSAFRYNAMNFMRGATSSTTTFGTTANNETSAIL